MHAARSALSQNGYGPKIDQVCGPSASFDHYGGRANNFAQCVFDHKRASLMMSAGTFDHFGDGRWGKKNDAQENDASKRVHTKNSAHKRVAREKPRETTLPCFLNALSLGERSDVLHKCTCSESFFVLPDILEN